MTSYSFDIALTIDDFKEIRKSVLGFHKKPSEKIKKIELKLGLIIEELEAQEELEKDE